MDAVARRAHRGAGRRDRSASAHLPAPVQLADRMEVDAEGRFILRGASPTCWKSPASAPRSATSPGACSTSRGGGRLRVPARGRAWRSGAGRGAGGRAHPQRGADPRCAARRRRSRVPAAAVAQRSRRCRATRPASCRARNCWTCCGAAKAEPPRRGRHAPRGKVPRAPARGADWHSFPTREEFVAWASSSG